LKLVLNIPIRAPVFKLTQLTKEIFDPLPSFIRDKSDSTALELQATSQLFDNQLKNIEKEINTNYQGNNIEPNEVILSLQIQKLQNCFDSFVDSLTAQQSDNITKVRYFRGRERCFIN